MSISVIILPTIYRIFRKFLKIYRKVSIYCYYNDTKGFEQTALIPKRKSSLLKFLPDILC